MGTEKLKLKLKNLIFSKIQEINIQLKNRIAMSYGTWGLLLRGSKLGKAVVTARIIS